MLYFLYGTDTIQTFEKSKSMVDAMLAKKPDASHFRITADNWSLSQLQELLGSQGLFENKYIVVLSRILDESEIKDQVLEYLQEMQDSENIFIWTEGALDSKVVKKIEQVAEKTQEFKEKENTHAVRFNTFALADALGNRDKKKLWTLYREALREIAVEEIHGVLVWQLKTLALISRSKTAAEAGVKPFVFSKGQRFSQKYSPEEIKKKMSDLISISHDARRGLCDFEIALERFILKV